MTVIVSQTPSKGSLVWEHVSASDEEEQAGEVVLTWTQETKQKRTPHQTDRHRRRDAGKIPRNPVPTLDSIPDSGAGHARQTHLNLFVTIPELRLRHLRRRLR